MRQKDRQGKPQVRLSDNSDNLLLDDMRIYLPVLLRGCLIHSTVVNLALIGQNVSSYAFITQLEAIPRPSSASRAIPTEALECQIRHCEWMHSLQCEVKHGWHIWRHIWICRGEILASALFCVLIFPLLSLSILHKAFIAFCVSLVYVLTSPYAL
ncbi:hypothetical protein HCH54_009444 [Aspergillus fumigatus]